MYLALSSVLYRSSSTLGIFDSIANPPPALVEHNRLLPHSSLGGRVYCTDIVFHLLSPARRLGRKRLIVSCVHSIGLILLLCISLLECGGHKGLHARRLYGRAGNPQKLLLFYIYSCKHHCYEHKNNKDYKNKSSVEVKLSVTHLF